MLRLRLGSGVLVGASFVLTGPISIAGDDEAVDLAALPSAVRNAADQAVPGGHWLVAKREVDKGKITYEVEGTTALGEPVEVEIEEAVGGAKAVKVEIRPGSAARSHEVGRSMPEPAEKPSHLWPIGLGLLAVLGLILKAIFADAFEAIGVAIAKALGADRLGKAVAGRISRNRSHLPIDPQPDPVSTPAHFSNPTTKL